MWRRKDKLQKLTLNPLSDGPHWVGLWALVELRAATVSGSAVGVPEGSFGKILGKAFPKFSDVL